MEFLARFSFHAVPFTRELRVDQCFRHPQFDQTLNDLANAVENRMSAALIAPAGSGKSTLLRQLADRLPQARYRVHYIKVTDLSKRDLCREIAAGVGLDHAGNFPALVRKLQDHFRSSTETDGLRPLLILDDAHDIRPNVIPLVRILTNFQMDSRLVLSIILAGQPPLGRLLARAELEDVARRLCHYAFLRLLSREECRAYIEHRLAAAGASKVPFDQSAFDAVFEIGTGNLRATDRLALKALEIAHQQNHDIVDGNHVAAARRHLWPSNQPKAFPA